MARAVELAREAIARQQAEFKEGTPQYTVGEQLKDIIGDDERLAEIVLEDLKIKEMSVSACEKKIKEYADQHRKGNFSFVSPKVAEGIIRTFYGIEDREQKHDKKVKLEDFF